MPEYLEDVETVRFIDGEDGTLPSRISELSGGKTLVQRFVKDANNQEYAYWTDVPASTVSIPLAYAMTTYRFNAITDHATEVTVSIDYEASPRWMGFVVKRAFNRAFRRDYVRAAEIIADTYIKETAGEDSR